MGKRNMSQHNAAPPRPASQQLTGQSYQHHVNPTFDYEQQLKRQIEQRKKQLAAQNVYGARQHQMDKLSRSLIGPLSYQRAPQYGYQQAFYGQNSAKLQNPTQLPMSYDHMAPSMEQTQYCSQTYNMSRKSMIPCSSNDWMSDSYAGQGRSGIGQPGLDEHDCDDEAGISDDDEPLRTRVKRHLSVMSQDSVRNDVFTSMASKRGPRRLGRDFGSEIEFFASKPTAIESKVQDPMLMQRPLPYSARPAALSNKTAGPASADNDDDKISWTLPKYEVQRQPAAKNEGLPTAKVSLPGMVREELVLSPDHADQEVHLLLQLFMPSQQALSTPEREPATALLNFHNIAIMVIETYVQFEIGDEVGLGRGHFHQSHSQGEEDYERTRDAKEANVEEIFFSVVDRWRAGLESKKVASDLIRGAQEFCDVALDIIYYIKENGLLRPEPQARRERSDKGVKRGPRAKTTAEVDAGKGKGKARTVVGKKPNQGIKRGTKQKPTEVQPRKKAKVEVTKKRAKPSTSGVTVMVKRR